MKTKVKTNPKTAKSIKTAKIAPGKLGPGEYIPDVAYRRIEDLPEPKIFKQDRNYQHQVCTQCHQFARRARVFTRTLHDIGDLVSLRPHDILLTYSQHHCETCRKYFNNDMTDLAPPGSHYTQRVHTLAVRLVVEDGLPYRAASWHLWRDHRVFVPFATIQNWVEAGGEKSQPTSRN